MCVFLWILEKGAFRKSCPSSVQYVRLHPILVSMLLYHYKQLTACISEGKQIEERVNSSKKKEWLTNKKNQKNKKERKSKTWHHNFTAQVAKVVC
jgi:hypothetical protein